MKISELSNLIKHSNVKDYKDFYKHLVLLKEIFDGFERDRVKNFALPDWKMGDSFIAFEKRDSCVRKLKTPIVSENDSENKIKQLKNTKLARRLS